MSARVRDLLRWKEGEMVGHVDADVLLYACSFAAQKTQWTHHERPGGVFAGKKEANDWCDHADVGAGQQADPAPVREPSIAQIPILTGGERKALGEPANLSSSLK